MDQDRPRAPRTDLPNWMMPQGKQNKMGIVPAARKSTSAIPAFSSFRNRRLPPCPNARNYFSTTIMHHEPLRTNRIRQPTFYNKSFCQRPPTLRNQQRSVFQTGSSSNFNSYTNISNYIPPRPLCTYAPPLTSNQDMAPRLAHTNGL
ncbi:unnamed protein product, partial [Didymodactylos carnosus]